jgi:hypothetical protein
VRADAWGRSRPAASVTLGLGARAPRQSRWTVLGRGVIALPLLAWLVVVSFAAAWVLVAAWCAAVVSGRVPDPLQRFMTDVVRYDAKVTAYLALLVDRWPGWWLRASASDQVIVEIEHVTLNRWAVVGRLILAMPAAVVSGTASLGASVLSVVMWGSALVLGRVPQALHEARAQVWRFVIRASAYVQLLTPTQPFEGFFADASAPAAASDATGAVGALSTTGTLSTWGRAVFIVTLLAGAYLQVQPGIVRWPFAYALDRSVGPRFVAAINDNIVADLANYTSTSPAGCVSDALGGCPLDAATAQVDVARQLNNLRAVAGLVVQGHSEYLAYEHQVLVIDLTLEQAANAPAGARSRFTSLVASQGGDLATRYVALRRAL